MVRVQSRQLTLLTKSRCSTLLSSGDGDERAADSIHQRGDTAERRQFYGDQRAHLCGPHGDRVGAGRVEAGQRRIAHGRHPRRLDHLHARRHVHQARHAQRHAGDQAVPSVRELHDALSKLEHLQVEGERRGRHARLHAEQVAQPEHRLGRRNLCGVAQRVERGEREFGRVALSAQRGHRRLQQPPGRDRRAEHGLVLPRRDVEVEGELVEIAQQLELAAEQGVVAQRIEADAAAEHAAQHRVEQAGARGVNARLRASDRERRARQSLDRQRLNRDGSGLVARQRRQQQRRRALHGDGHGVVGLRARRRCEVPRPGMGHRVPTSTVDVARVQAHAGRQVERGIGQGRTARAGAVGALQRLRAGQCGQVDRLLHLALQVEQVAEFGADQHDDDQADRDRSLHDDRAPAMAQPAT